MRVRAARSYLDSVELGRAVGHALGVDDVRLVALSFGVNDFYRIDGAAEPLVLRVSPANRWSPNEIAAELALLRQLDDAGVAVGCPRSFDNGADLLAIHAPEGERTATLFGFMEGSLLTDTATDAADLGQALARIHAVGEPALAASRPVYDSAELLGRSVVVIADHFAHLRAEVKALEKFAREAVPRVDRFGAEHSVGVIHGDVQLRNAMRAPDGRVAVFDFDECGRGWAADDMAIFLMLARGRRQPDLAEAFLRGYESERKLSDEEHDLLDVFIRARAIWAAAWQLRMAKQVGPAAWLDEDWLVALTS